MHPQPLQQRIQAFRQNQPFSDIQSSQNGSEFSRFAGHGANLNLYLLKKLENSSLKFQARNIGFVSWQDQYVYTADTLVQYTGTDIINNTSSSINNGDDINEILGVEASRKTTTKWLPTLLHVEYQYDFSRKFNLASGIKYYLVVNNLPQVYARPTYTMWGKDFSLDVSTILAGGGFSRFDVGIGARFQYQSTYIYFDSFQLEQLLFSDKSYSAGFSVGAGILF